MPIIIRNTEQLYRQLNLLPTDLLHFRRPTAIGGQKDYSISVLDFFNIITESIVTSGDVDATRFIGNWDASLNLFPETGGSGVGGVIAKANMFRISVKGILKDSDEQASEVIPGTLILALVNAPGQVGFNWRILS